MKAAGHGQAGLRDALGFGLKEAQRNLNTLLEAGRGQLAQFGPRG